MAVFTAVKDGDMDAAATFGGATTPATGDEIALGGYTVSCSTDKRALATGITISGIGKLLILSGGAFKTAKDIPATCAVQFGEPVGVGAGPLPAYGALDANASGEIFLNGNIRIYGPCAVYTLERTGKMWATVSVKISTTQSVLDATETDWRAGDIVVPFSQAYADEYGVTDWSAGTATLTHAAMAANYNNAGTILVNMSCAALVKRTTVSGYYILYSGLTGFGAVYCSFNNGSGVFLGSVNFSGRVAMCCYSSYAYASKFLGGASGYIQKVFNPGYIASLQTISGIEIGGGICSLGFAATNVGGKATLKNTIIKATIATPSYQVPFELTLIDCTLPTPLLSGFLAPGQFVKVANAAMTTETVYTEGGIATQVQHAALPGTNDLPDAYLLAPVTGRAIYDYWLTVKRGQTARIRFHAWLSTANAKAGYEIFDKFQLAPEVQAPLASYVVPPGTETLEWHRPTPQTYYNGTGRDQLLRIRAWATGDNCYVRCSPEQGGGAL